MKIKEAEGEVGSPEEQKVEIDKHIKGEHEFRALEVPVFGFGFSIHENKCNSCYQSPIIGVCMSCTSCKNFKLCTYFIIKVKNAILSVQGTKT